jgi:hypothetical protein
MTEIAEWHVKHRKAIDTDSLHKIVIKYYPFNENQFGDFFRTPQGHSLFKKVILLVSWQAGINKTPPDIYVKKENSATILLSSWIRERDTWIKKGERVPEVTMIFPELSTEQEPSNLRESTLFNDTYKGERYTYGLKYRPLGSAAVPPRWIIWSEKKHPDFNFGTIDYPRKLTQYEIESFQLTEINQPSNLREPAVLPETGESCQMVPDRYRDLLPLLDSYPVGSFLLEPSTAPGTAKIDAILQKLKDGVAAIQDSSLFREYLLTMSKFWSYSIGNLILIMLQKHDATRVAGFTTWKELGRFVKAGEHGISILAPCLPPKGGYEYWAKGDNKYSARYLNGEWFIYNVDSKQSEGPYRSKVDVEAELIHRGFSKVKEEVQETYEAPRYFKVVYVFDISQTSGKELPVIEVRSLTGEANPELWEKMLNLLKRKNVNLSFESRPDQNPEIKGQFMMPKDIWVRPEESPAQQLKTLIHETGHYYTEAVFMTARADAETIAESVAFVVGAHFGFDSGTRSFPYVAVWSQDKKVLEKNLASIKNISSSILNDLEAK